MLSGSAAESRPLLLQAGRSDFHLHTCFSDGAADCTIQRVAQVAEGLGLREIGFTDHLLACNWDAEGCGLQPGDESGFADLCRQIREVDSSLRAYVSWEVEFFDGGLYSFDPERHLGLLDYVLLGFHWMTHRLSDPPQSVADWLVGVYLAMAQEPYANIIAHPFYVPPPAEQHRAIVECVTDAQFVEVFSALREHGKAAEITPYQFSADRRAVDEMCRMYAAAKTTGVKFTLDSDAHKLDVVGSGIRVAYVLSSLGFSDDDFVDYEGLMALKG